MTTADMYDLPEFQKLIKGLASKADIRRKEREETRLKVEALQERIKPYETNQ
jgi:hypothetical protein